MLAAWVHRIEEELPSSLCRMAGKFSGAHRVEVRELAEGLAVGAWQHSRLVTRLVELNTPVLDIEGFVELLDRVHRAGIDPRRAEPAALVVELDRCLRKDEAPLIANLSEGLESCCDCTSSRPFCLHALLLCRALARHLREHPEEILGWLGLEEALRTWTEPRARGSNRPPPPDRSRAVARALPTNRDVRSQLETLFQALGVSRSSSELERLVEETGQFLGRAPDPAPRADEEKGREVEPLAGPVRRELDELAGALDWAHQPPRPPGVGPADPFWEVEIPPLPGSPDPAPEPAHAVLDELPPLPEELSEVREALEVLYEKLIRG